MNKTLSDILKHHSQRVGKRRAFLFLERGATGPAVLTYGALYDHSIRVAALLRNAGVRHGDPVLLLFPPGLDFVTGLFGCMFAGAIAVPTTDPVRLGKTAARLTSIIADVRPRVGLTVSSVLARHERQLLACNEAAVVHWLAVDDRDDVVAATAELPELVPDSVAVIQYSSGSTSAPKGVVLTHQNLVCAEAMIEDIFGETGESIFAGWLPPYHDMGLIGLMLHPIYLGAQCILLSPHEYLRRPFRWLKAISDFRVTASVAPNFAFDLCVERVTDSERDTLDLSSLRVLVNGAEPVRQQTIDGFCERFGPAGFRSSAFSPCYGLAEATLLVSGCRPEGGRRVCRVKSAALQERHVTLAPADAAQSRTVVSCGRPARGIEVAIVDPDNQTECPGDQIGEIWVAGASVAGGYWGKTELSHKMFCAQLPSRSGRNFLRTGDLGFLLDGELFVTGRLSDLIVIRGRNIHPEDVERTAEDAHAAVLPHASAAFSIETADGERLVLAQEVRRSANLDCADVAAALRRAVAIEHEIEVYAVVLLRAGAIPRTSSGKIRRKACRDAWLAGALPELYRRHQWAPAHEGLDRLQHEELLRLPATGRFARMRDVLRLAVSHLLHIAPDELNGSMLDCGLDSLRAIKLQHMLEERLGMTLSISEIGQSTIDLLAHKLLQSRAHPLDDVQSRHMESELSFPLTPAQQALWFEYQRDPTSSAYHLGGAVRINGCVSLQVFRRALEALLFRHPSLRTAFDVGESGPRQHVFTDFALPFLKVNAAAWADNQLVAELNEEFNRPFNLRDELPLRVKLYERSTSECIVVLTVHHLIADFASLETLVEEWMGLYQAEAEGVMHLLPDSRASYAEYIRWYERFQASSEAASLQSYWNERLRGAVPALELPQCRARSSMSRHRGARSVRMLDRDLTESIGALARREGVTPFAVLFAVFNIILHRYTGQADIAVGTPASIRPTSLFDRTVGYFVNTVVLRTQIDANKDCASFLRQVQTGVWDALDHAAYPFSWIAQERRRNGESDAISVLQTMFVYYARTGSNLGLGAAALQPSFKIGTASCEITTIPLQRRGCQFDLCLEIADCGSEMACSFDYDTDLFAREDIDRMLGHYETVLQSISRNASVQIARVPLLTKVEVRRFEEWNATANHYSEPHVLHELVEAQVERTPAAIALSCDNHSMTYADLSERSTALAVELMACGAERARPVAVVFHPGLEMVVGLLATIKAGAAYVPIDPDDGGQRIEKILASACPALILTTPKLRNRLPSATVPVLCFDCKTFPSRAGNARQLPQVTADDLAYIIYTSGSTGEPKGAMISHRAICNRLLWMRDQYPLTSSDRILQKTPYTFDVSVWELFLPLIAGREMVIARTRGFRNPAYLANLICERGVTIIHFVPSMLRLFLAEPNVEKCACLRRVFASGEALTSDLVDLFHRRLCAELHNLYGPTEAAVDVSYWFCRRDQCGPVPIGYPIANIQLYVLDENRNRVPVGVPGDLYIGGAGLAEGYWRQPELTQAAFVSLRLEDGHCCRVYRTGDRARYRADGSLEFLGRLDRQIKIRGVRVEPGEIEAALRRHAAVIDCAVVGQTADGQNTQLMAYLVVRHESPTTGELRRFLRQHLPDAFLPSQFRIVNALPRTSSGKLKPNALPTLASCRELTESEEPCTPEEILLARVWSGVLSASDIRVTDNFFERGGDSLRSLQVRARLLQAGYSIDVEQLFKSPTIRELAVHLQRVEIGAGAPSTQPFSLVSEEIRAALQSQFTDAFPLSRLQEVLLFHSRNDSDYEVYLLSITVNAIFDEEAMRDSLDVLARRHEMLRVSYLLEFDEFLQVVHRSVEIPLTVCDLTRYSAAEQDRLLDEWIDSERRHPFDWTTPPLIRMRVDRRTFKSFQLTVSHALYDGWSLMSLLVELLQEYLSRRSGAPSPLRPPPASYYRDFVAAEQAIIDSRAAREFWRAQLDSANFRAISTPLTGSDAVPGRARRKVALPAKVVDGLRALARAAQVPLKSVLLTAHLRVISFLTGEPDVMTGLITNGRLEQPDGDRVVGLFLNTVPLRIRFGDENWNEMVRAVFLAEQQLWPYRRFPLAEIRPLAAKTPFDTAFNFVNLHVVDQLREREDLRISAWKNPSDLTFFPICAYFTEDPISSSLLFSLDYDKRCFAAHEVENKLEYYLKAFESAAFTPDSSAAQAQLLGESELTQMCPWRSQAVAWASWPQTPIHQLFSESVQSHSHAIAVIGVNERLSYLDLEKRANRLARYLMQLGVTTETPIGVWVDRTPEMVVALLGILKAGAAFVPLDGAGPRERLLSIKRDCGLNLLVADRSFPDGALGYDVTAIRLDSELIDQCADGDPLLDTGSDALAYIMYTSGSSGEPKGVEVTHGGLANILRSIGERIAISPSDTWLAVTSLCFDISVLEIFLPLIVGARVVVAGSDEVRDGDRLKQRLASTGATIMQATPSGWRLLLDAGWRGSQQLRILSGGEALSRALADQLLSRASAVWNVYGPTETTIWSTCAKLELSDTGAPSIGHPLANTSVYVLDAALQRLPIGVAGELYIGGAGVARGYRNRPDQTAERFCYDPFFGGRGARMYRTGDRVRMRSDGSLEFLGRLDGQIKIRGFRVETGEIETVLRRHPDVKEAIVGVRTVTSDEDTRLIAVLLAASKLQPHVTEMHRYAASLLPPYMLPAEFIFVASYPMTPNGKVDRSALFEAYACHRASAPPTSSEAATVTENVIADIWKELLHVDTVSRDANFFDIGGHSLLVMRACVRIGKIFGISLSAIDFFKYPTIATLASHLDTRRLEPTPDGCLPIRLSSLPLPLVNASTRRKKLWTADVH